MSATIDVVQLFVSLLTIALLQEFIIKPGVEFLKRHYHRSRKHISKIIKNNNKKRFLT